jgi:alkanesulfonate monooxygenase SsuD/methylene tetrahydromethanopterin reductase-like flavin-dependent oxidoreductase (luciferase family)
MRGFLVGRDRAELRERVTRLGEVIPGLSGLDPEQALAGIGQRFFVGTPEEIVAQMRPFAQAGVDLFMLQHFLMDDGDALELLAREVLPRI